VRSKQHSLYRDAQNDYWEARARRARRTLSALMGTAAAGGANWTSIADLEPYLAADAVTRQFADATGGTFVPA
jgi:hypothetical protein